MTEHSIFKGQQSGSSRLVERFDSEPFALVFAGQGFDWLKTLRASVAQGAGKTLEPIVAEAAQRLIPISDVLAVARPFGFKPLEWAEQDENAGVDTSQAAISVPGILTSQLATLDLLESQGLDVDKAAAVIGHSQGVLGVHSVRDLTRAAEILAIAEIIGAVIGHQARVTGLVARGGAAPMVSIDGITCEQLEGAIAAACSKTDKEIRPVVGLKNSRTNFVLVGRPKDNESVLNILRSQAAADAREVEAKKRGGSAFDPKIAPLNVQVAFHHPAMLPAVDRVVELAERAGLDAEMARQIALDVMVTPVDWSSDVQAALDQGARWFLDVGPDGGVVSLTEQALMGRGAASFAVCGAEGQAQLFDAGRASALPQSFEAFSPTLIKTPQGVRVKTKFTELTGRSPMLLAGMTPTTVDPEIVAAAANAGHWAELAGGGQVTPEILENNIAKLTDLLQPGVNAQFNSMFLDLYLWKMQIGGKRLVPKARENGAPIDGIVITAGIPEHEEAVALVHELRSGGFPWVAFKPGAVKHIIKILAIAKDVPEVPIIMQIEGGKAGGHHSWEDLDELLISTYAKIREHDNVVICVGGGIGTPERAADYLTGSWARGYGLPDMPVDGILVGTAAMATKEAKTSEAVKQLLVETKGTQEWVAAGSSNQGMASGLSQLGADIHEIDNSFAKAGRLLDSVAGDAEAVAAKREEIIAAIAKTAKPYFGDVEDMTYQQWLERYLELSGPMNGKWIDSSWYRRFVEMLHRAEARLIAQDHGSFASVISLEETEAPQLGVDKLCAHYPASDTLVHPADAAWFLEALATPGKPANFVPVIDKDVRRRWRSDSLWQAHDERYTADQVAIIPGTAAVSGITMANEPVADLLARFNAATVDRLDAAEAEEPQAGVVERVLSASGTSWAGRQVDSLTARLGDASEWAVDATAATHALSGARLIELDSEHAELQVPLFGSTAPGTEANIAIRFTLPQDAPAGCVPLVTREDAETAMEGLTQIAAGGVLGSLGEDELTAIWYSTLSRGDAATYETVTAGYLPADIEPAGIAPDILVGKAWPAIFTAVRNAVIPDSDGAKVVEGMLSLVHLEHHVTVVDQDLFSRCIAAETDSPVAIEVSARAEEIVDTTIGRIVVVRAELRVDSTLLARLSERMAIRGRRGNAVARTNTSALPSVIDAPRSFRAFAKVTAPHSMHPFAVATGDRNPIHVSETAAKLAGLRYGVIVHGMWTSAMAELIAAGGYSDESVSTRPNTVVEYTATMLAPVLPGQEVEFLVERSGIDSREGHGEVREITATVNGSIVLTATAVMAAPTTFYAFPGQGIQSQGMGMESRARSGAARDVWARADHHTRTALGFSVLDIVQNNPTEVRVAGETFSHPKGVLFLTQFTQVAMATLGVAQIAEMREAGALDNKAWFAGHSVGEYNALAAYAGVLSLESVVEIVYQRGLTMHRLVERDQDGNSNYGLAALRPHKMGLTEPQVFDYVAGISQESGEFLEIVNYNLAGMQYAVAGTSKGLQALGADAERRAPGKRAFIMIPGIDVPFHSSHLLDGVDAFREHLDSLIPADVDLSMLVDRYVPNLVARPFELTRDFVSAMLDVAPAPILKDVLERFDELSKTPVTLARTLLVELLAWQFASPVRWIETQDLILRSNAEGGLGVERFVEVGVGSAPTIANMMGQTLRLPQYDGAEVEVLNIERDRSVVFATDELTRTVSAQDAETETASEDTAQDVATVQIAAAVTPTEAPAASGGDRPDDITFTPADATMMLIALWTKVRPDQMGDADSIESLVEGVSSRRNQLLLDLGVEFGLGAIDGAADAELVELKKTVSRMAKGYSAFGPVLSDAANDALRRITGPTGKRPNYISERVGSTWQLGAGWVDHVTAAVVIGAREGSSLRGGDLATLAPSAPSNAAELDQLIDAAVQEVAAGQGVSVALPGGSAAAGGVVDSAALGEFAEHVTGKEGVLAATARTILSSLGLHETAETQFLEDSDADTALYELVSQELGADWPRQVAPSFDANQAVLLDDRWASAREDLSRAALGQVSVDSLDLTGAGEIVAQQAEFFGFEELAAQARSQESLAFADDVAVVTGASPNSIAAAVTAELLSGGATVVVTTSSLSHSRLQFYKELYRESARGRAGLWIVPANLSSFADIDAIIKWVGEEQTATVNAQKQVIKPALVPTLLFPFAAPRVQGSLSDAGPQAEMQMRLLLWSVERLIAGLSQLGTNTHVGERLHVVLPGSPNRGRFGGDGAYGESKAALDALVTRWNVEKSWKPHTSLVHVLIGWVRGTGLMGGNDPLVEAVEAAGVTTYSTQEIAEILIGQVSAEVRRQAAESPITVDYTGGLAECDLNLAELASSIHSQASEEPTEPEDNAPALKALPTIASDSQETHPDFRGQVHQNLEDMVVIVGAGELGPYGSARTRFEAELTGDLGAAGVLELAWTMGLVHWDEDPKPGWYDADDELVDEADIYDRFHDEVLARVGVRRYHDDFHMVDNLAPELTTVYLDRDLSFSVSDKDTARSFVESEPDLTSAVFNEETGEWVVTRKAGSAVRVPRRMAMSRFVGGQIPEGFDPGVYGIPADMVDNLDRTALWNLVCTVDAFLSSGFSPAELLRELHPARVSSTQGTGLGGMQSMRALYIDGLLSEPRQNDILQEALPNVMAAHVMQSYVGGYGQMIHPVAACATAAVSVEEAVDKIKLGKSDFVVAGGFDDLSIEGITGFGDMAATADSQEMRSKGIEDRYFSRANDRRRGGFVESAGGGTVLLARGTLAAELGLPVLGVVGFAESFADGAHLSIPAPGLGALGAARGGKDSRLLSDLKYLGVSADDIRVVSKHDTSTNANDPNESDLHERIARAIGRTEGNPLYVVSQKSLTGHAKGGAAAFQLIGLTQVLRTGIVPANYSLDCVDPVLAKHSHLVWLRQPLNIRQLAPKAGIVTSLGFGHVSALVAIVHPEAFAEAVRSERGEEALATWRKSAADRERAGKRRLLHGMMGRTALYERPVERNLGSSGDAGKEREAAVLLNDSARLVDGILVLSPNK
ncbi:Fatty acid synthase [Corynebacterium pseudotuberculosis]|uniref:type I polyketide synthase n=1 Tax=Corynebacterium pseudotuberculosis TaxID=1719 RepID=UPI000CDC2211|nr:type I polyketide synthase [Corynebacterium pseudotuberculosis]AUZ42881.1 Fatty acid synthase [Corynebacterium pseudotuberculosis]